MKDGLIGSKSCVPAFEGRLLVIVTIEKIGVWHLTFNFDEDKGSEVLFSVRDDLNFGSLNS